MKWSRKRLSPDTVHVVYFDSQQEFNQNASQTLTSHEYDEGSFQACYNCTNAQVRIIREANYNLLQKYTTQSFTPVFLSFLSSLVCGSKLITVLECSALTSA